MKKYFHANIITIINNNNNQQPAYNSHTPEPAVCIYTLQLLFGTRFTCCHPSLRIPPQHMHTPTPSVFRARVAPQPAVTKLRI